MPTRVCATCGRLWSSSVRRRFGERCPECEAKAAALAEGPGRRFLRDASDPVGDRGPVTSSPVHRAGDAVTPDLHAGPPSGGAFVC